MRNKILIVLLSIFICCCLGIGLSACSAKDNIFKPEKEYVTNYTGEYTGELDDGVKIDGIIDDSIWENANYLTSSFLQNENADDSFPKMQITAVPGQYGVYINSVMYDNNIVMYSEYGAYAPRYTTGWQIHFLNIQRGEDIMSISTSEMAVRVKNFTLDSWGNLVFNTPELQGLAAIKIDGVVNSGNTNSITMETFISYESMQLDVSNGIPDTFYMYPINRSVFIGRTSASEMQPENLYNTWQPSYYYSFNEHGFVDSFADNFVLGNAPSGLARTAGWEYFDDDTPSVKSTREQAQTVYFSEVYADSFVLETDIEFAEDITHFTQNKQTVGVEILSPNGNGLTFVVGDNHFDYDRHQYDKYMIQIGNRDFATSYATGIMDAPIESNSFTLRLEKIRQQVMLYINDELFLYSDVSNLNLSGKVYVGLFTKNGSAIYKNFVCNVNVDKNGEYKFKANLQNSTFSGYDQPNEINIAAQIGSKVSVPQIFLIGNVSYQLETGKSDEVLEATVNEQSTVELNAYYDRRDYIASVGASYKLLAENKESVIFEANAQVGQDGQLFNGFVVSQGTNAMSFVFHKQEIWMQSNANGGNWYANNMDGTVLRDYCAYYRTASTNILKADHPVKIRLMLYQGTIYIWAEDDSDQMVLYMIADMNVISTIDGLGAINFDRPFSIGVYGFDGYLTNYGQDVTFSNYRVSEDITEITSIQEAIPDSDINVEIQIKDNKGGNLSVSQSKYHVGDPLTITAIPDDGLELGVLDLEDSNGNRINLLEYALNDTTYRYVFGRNGNYTIYAEFVDSSYQVKIYLMNVDGSVVEKELTETRAGLAGEEITVIPETIIENNGNFYVYDESNKNNIITETIRSDGSTVFEIYYNLYPITLKNMDFLADQEGDLRFETYGNALKSVYFNFSSTSVVLEATISNAVNGVVCNDFGAGFAIKNSDGLELNIFAFASAYVRFCYAGNYNYRYEIPFTSTSRPLTPNVEGSFKFKMEYYKGAIVLYINDVVVASTTLDEINANLTTPLLETLSGEEEMTFGLSALNSYQSSSGTFMDSQATFTNVTFDMSKIWYKLEKYSGSELIATEYYVGNNNEQVEIEQPAYCERNGQYYVYDSENEGNILSGTVTDAGLVLKAYYTPYINVKSNSGFTMADNGSGGINVQAGNSGCMMLEGSSTNFTLEATFHATDTNFHVGFVISDGTNTVYMLMAGRLLYIQNGPTWNNRVGGIVLSNQALMTSGSITVRMTYEASDDINTLGTLTFYIINEGVPTQAGRVTLYQMNNEKCEEGETLHGIANATTPLGETGLQTTFEAGASLFCGFGGYQPVSGNPYITDISWTDHTASEAN